jgi:hypothetical protein
MTTPTHAILFQPFYIIETYQLREIKPFIHSYEKPLTNWGTIRRIRHATYALWHVTRRHQHLPTRFHSFSKKLIYLFFQILSHPVLSNY